MKKPFYITTTLPYVNAEPHIGFAMEIIRADMIARAQKLAGREVFFNTGTDEHGIKIYQSAKAMNLPSQAYVDSLAKKYKELLPLLDIMPEINFIRTTDDHHKQAAQEFWKIVDRNGFIYKKHYETKYCVGCELEKTDSELVNGRCPLHPIQELEIIEEENYFFKFSAFQQKLLDLYKENQSLVIPDFRFNEAKKLVEGGLEDFSISRLASKMSWGIPVPGDADHVMYVWFDALVDYISAIGWPDDTEKFDKWWIKTGGIVQYCGKDQIRQQAVMWQAMLMAAGLSQSQAIVVDGFITGDGGLKMSKSLGNTICPFEIVREYGADALRYYFAREVPPFEDSPFTMERFKEAYNAHLANGLGNLTSRVLKMATSNGIVFDEHVAKEFAASAETKDLCARQTAGFEAYDLQKAANAVWDLIGSTDKIVQERQPFKKIKTDKTGAGKDIKELLARLHMIGTMLLPILPQTAETIVSLVEKNEMPAEPLFMRK